MIRTMLYSVTLAVVLATTACSAQPPAARTTSGKPFAVTGEGKFADPFAMAFLPDGRLLVTEKGGTLKLRGTDGRVIAVAGGCGRSRWDPRAATR